MKKTEAIELLGNSVKSAAKEIGISPSAVSQWPDVLPNSIRDRVQAALWRRHFLAPSERQSQVSSVAPEANPQHEVAHSGGNSSSVYS